MDQLSQCRGITTCSPAAGLQQLLRDMVAQGWAVECDSVGDMERKLGTCVAGVPLNKLGLICIGVGRARTRLRGRGSAWSYLALAMC
eukprot:3690566-Amphidinium_carterae.3